MDIHSCFEQGKFADAIRFLDDFIEKNPSNPVGYCNRAAANFHLELYRKCIKDCDFAIKLDENCLRAYIRKGLSLMQLNKKEEAHKVWNDGKSKIGDVELHMGLIRLLKGQPATPVIVETSTPPTRTASTPSVVIPASNINYKSDGENELTLGDDNNGTIALGGPTVKTLPPGYDPNAASAAVAAKGLVQHGVGQKEVDEKIALGYLHVNTGNFIKGIEIFNQLIQVNPTIVAAYLGRGTALALMGDLDRATMDFSAAIQINPKITDAWKRRGQTRAARGLDADAIADLTRAIDLDNNDSETYHQRGLVYYKQRNYRRALADFKKSTSIDKMNKLSWNHLGLCLNAVGQSVEAIEAHARASTLDEKFKEAWSNMAQAYKDLGQFDKSEQLFAKAISIDPTYVQAYHLRALARFGTGDHRMALDDLTKALKNDPKHLDSRHMHGVISHGLGLFSEAVADYNIAIQTKPDHVAWYQKEIALYIVKKLDVPVSEFNIDAELDPYFKEGFCKRHHPATLVRYVPVKLSGPIKDCSLNPTLSPEGLEIMKIAKIFGPKIQLNSPGYLPNKRQHAMCGLAVLELAQKLRAVWFQGDTKVNGKNSSGNRQLHEFGWRDLYDTLIKWRQLSEPNDPVWWVDLLSPEQFEEGFGSHTPMITGQTNVIRYSPMAKRAFPIIKDLLPIQHQLTDESKKSVEEAKDIKDLYEVMRHDFWVCTPCYSVADPGKTYEGTRLTLQYVAPEGFEFSIRTPGTPPRWKQYDLELTYVYDHLVEEIKKGKDMDMQKASDWILTLTFYWYNFMPLSRGTAALGYMGLLAMFLALDTEIATFVPKDVQVDWEGILRPTHKDFIDNVSPWMYPARKPFSIKDLPSVSSVFNTPKKIIEAMTYFCVNP